MIKIKCIDNAQHPWDCNKRLDEIEEWLSENVGLRWKDYDWTDPYGTILIKDIETATFFKLKFGI